MPEQLPLKQDVFAALDKICKPSCVFASNTSGLVIEEIAAKCSDERKKIFGGMQCAPARQLSVLNVSAET